MASTSKIAEDPEARSETELPVAWWKRAISFPVFLGAVLAGFAGYEAHLHLADPDTWWHAKVGQLILSTGHLPTHDIYSFTVKGNPWIAYEWIGEVVIGWASKWGVSGLLLLLGVLGGLLLLLLYVYGTVCTGNVKASVTASAILLPLITVFFTLRPQLLGYCFLVLLLILMERYRQGHEKVLWAIPPLFLVWVNTHGSFFVGLGIFGVFWFCGLFHFEWGGLEAKPWTKRQSRNLLLTMLASVALLPLTPYGTKLAAYPFEMAILQPLNFKSIQEWQPIGFGAPWGKAFLLMLVALFLVQLFWKPRFRLFDLVFLLVTLGEAALHIRFLIIFIFAFFPWFARLLTRWLTPYDERKDKYALNAVLICLMVLGFIHFFPSPKQIDKQLSKTYPLHAFAYLKTHSVPEPMLNEYGWGGYLIWTFGTSRPVFIDGRADIYEYGGVLRDYMNLSELKRETPLVLAKYKIRSAFIQGKSALATYLRALPDWSVVYEGKDAVIFVFHGSYPKARLKESEIRSQSASAKKVSVNKT